MNHSAYEKIGCSLERCFLMYVYRPQRARKGHYYWKRHYLKAGPLTAGQVRTMGMGDVLRDFHKHGSLHNRRLTEDEVIKSLAMYTYEQMDYQGEGLA